MTQRSSKCFHLQGVPAVITASSFMETHLEGGSSRKPSTLTGEAVAHLFPSTSMCNFDIDSQPPRTIMSHPELNSILKEKEINFQKDVRNTVKHMA